LGLLSFQKKLDKGGLDPADARNHGKIAIQRDLSKIMAKVTGTRQWDKPVGKPVYP
jgi:hypothetical protein